jgi:hypothetical protein
MKKNRIHILYLDVTLSVIRIGVLIWIRYHKFKIVTQEEILHHIEVQENIFLIAKNKIITHLIWKKDLKK